VRKTFPQYFVYFIYFRLVLTLYVISFIFVTVSLLKSQGLLSTNRPISFVEISRCCLQLEFECVCLFGKPLMSHCIIRREHLLSPSWD